MLFSGRIVVVIFSYAESAKLRKTTETLIKQSRSAVFRRLSAGGTRQKRSSSVRGSKVFGFTVVPVPKKVSVGAHFAVRIYKYTRGQYALLGLGSSSSGRN